MNVVSKHGEDVTISASKAELARLGKLLVWIRDNISVMDEAMILMPEEEIVPSIREWEKLIDSHRNG